ncbi:MAG: helix-turn-helix domain-containing protein, partial [Candidatus Fonsibacter sp.]
MYTTILTLYKQGKSQREIAKLTGRNRKTIFINLISMLL